VRGNYLKAARKSAQNAILHKEGEQMETRKRKVQIIVRVTEEERELIKEKMKQIPTINLSAYGPAAGAERN
jgi:predicted NBD/HSP70 family sugar kinase